MAGMESLALLGFVAFMLLNLVRYIRGGFSGQGWNGAVTIVAGWVVGFVLAWVFGSSDIGGDLVVPGFDIALKDLGITDLILVGLVIASTAGAFNELKGALDDSVSTAKPKLIQHPPPEEG